MKFTVTLNRSIFWVFIASASACILIFIVQKVATPVAFSLLLLPLLIVIYGKIEYKYMLYYVVLFSLMTGNEINLILIALVASIFKLINFFKNSSIVRLEKYELMILILFIIGLFSFTFTQFVELNTLSYFLHLTTFFSSLVLFIELKNTALSFSNKQTLFVSIISIAMAEVVLAYIDYVGPNSVLNVLRKINASPDEVYATLGNANNFGLYIFISAVLVLGNIKSFNSRFAFLALVIVLLFFSFLADAKTYLLGAVGIIFFVGFVRTFKILSFIQKILLTLLILGLNIFIVPKAIESVKPVFHLFHSLYVEGKYNHKFIYYKRAFSLENRTTLQAIIGTGPGTCGSRAANARAYNSLYKKSDGFSLSFLPPKTSVYAYNLLVDLYQYEYAVNARFRSAFLGNPFNSWTSVLIEYGILGFFILHLFFLFLFIRIYNTPSIYKNAALILIGAIYVAAWIDQALERPFPMIFMFLICALALQKKKYYEC